MEDLNEQQRLAYEFNYYQKAIFTMHIKKIDKAPDVDVHIPWFLDCNRQRYPYWLGQADPRNKVFVEALSKKGNQVKDGEEPMLFLIEGCNDFVGKNYVPCPESWIKINKTLDDPGAGIWARKVLMKRVKVED